MSTLSPARFRPSDCSRSASSVRRRGKVNSTTTLIVALVALAGVVAMTIYLVQVYGPLRQRLAEQDALIAQLTGVNNDRVINTLAPRYTDADGDLVADPPSDPAKHLDPPVLKVSYVATDSTSFKTAFAEMVTALAEATGKRVEYVDYDSVESQLLDLHEGRLHVTALNTGAVPIGVCAAGFVPVAQMSDDSGEGGYHMQIIVPADSSIRSLQDLHGKDLAVTEPSSNSGYKAPLILLRELNMRPPTDYRLRYSYGHMNSIAGIKNKVFAAAAVADDVLNREIAAGRIATTDFRSIYRSEQRFPTATIGYAYNLKPELAQKVRQAVLNFNWKGTGLERAFGHEGKTRFIPVDYRRDWEYVRRIDDLIGDVYRLRMPMLSTQPTTAVP